MKGWSRQISIAMMKIWFSKVKSFYKQFSNLLLTGKEKDTPIDKDKEMHIFQTKDPNSKLVLW